MNEFPESPYKGELYAMAKEAWVRGLGRALGKGWGAVGKGWGAAKKWLDGPPLAMGPYIAPNRGSANRAANYVMEFAKKHPYAATTAGTVGAAAAAHTPSILGSIFSGNGYGQRQMRQDSQTLAGSADSIIKALGLTALGTGVVTGVSHIMRDADSELEDPDLLQADVNEMGARPQRKKYKKTASIIPSDWFLNQDNYNSAPADAGTARYGAGIADGPWWLLPGLAAGAAGGYLGGKSLADWLGYGLRERPVKKRHDKAKKEFEETVAGYSKGAALERRLDDGYRLYKQAKLPLGLLATGMGAAGVLSALAAYERFKAPTSLDVYKKNLSRYLVGGARRPVVRVRPSTEVALERGDEDEEEKAAALTGGAVADDRPFIIGGKQAVLPLAVPLLATAGYGVYRGIKSLVNSGQDFAAQAKDMYDNASAPERMKAEQAVRNAPISGDAEQSFVAAAGKLADNRDFNKGLFEGLDANLPGGGTPLSATQPKAAGVLDAVGGLWNNGVGGAYAGWQGLEGIGAGLGERVSDEVAKRVDGFVDDKLRTSDGARQFGKQLAGGGSFGSGAAAGPAASVEKGVREGLASEQGFKNPITRLMYSGFGNNNNNKAAGVEKAIDDVTVRAGKAFATTPGGLGDRLGEVVQNYAGSRFGGFGAGLFDPNNDGWLSAIGGGLSGLLGGYDTKQQDAGGAASSSQNAGGSVISDDFTRLLLQQGGGAKQAAVGLDLDEAEADPRRKKKPGSSWLLPSLGVGGLGAGALAYALLQSKTPPSAPVPAPAPTGGGGGLLRAAVKLGVPVALSGGVGYGSHKLLRSVGKGMGGAFGGFLQAISPFAGIAGGAGTLKSFAG